MAYIKRILMTMYKDLPISNLNSKTHDNHESFTMRRYYSVPIDATKIELLSPSLPKQISKYIKL